MVDARDVAPQLQEYITHKAVAATEDITTEIVTREATLQQ